MGMCYVYETKEQCGKLAGWYDAQRNYGKTFKRSASSCSIFDALLDTEADESAPKCFGPSDEAKAKAAKAAKAVADAKTALEKSKQAVKTAKNGREKAAETVKTANKENKKAQAAKYSYIEQTYSGGYQYCTTTSLSSTANSKITGTKQPNAAACRAQCKGCWAFTYYSGNTGYSKMCYVYETKEQCGKLAGWYDAQRNYGKTFKRSASSC